MSDISIKKTSSKPGNALGAESDVDVFSLKIVIAASAVMCVLAAVIFDKTKDLSGLRFPIFGLSMVGAVAVYLAVTKKLTTRNIILLMFAAGFVIRLNYVLFTSVTARVRQHDVYKFGGEKGHSAYIEFFYNNGFTLPDFNPTTKAQFYHPPLHHFLSALWLRLLTTFGMSYQRAISSLAFPTLFYSMCSLVICERILDKLKLRGLGKIIPLAIMVFHPTFILFSGSINNDNLASLFTLLAVYAVLNWYQNPTTKNILLIALSIGLGMSTKLSVALIAPPIAVVFLLKLITETGKFKENIKQYAAFGCLCLPLGLWYTIRNVVKYDVPFNYVPRLSESSEQYIGSHSVYERLVDLSYHPFKNVFLNRIATDADYYEYNPFVAIIKTSIFGEYNLTKYYENITPICRILLVLNIIMIAVSLIATAYCLFRKNSFMDTAVKTLLMSYQILMFAFYMKFVFDYPHNCSMDYRYLVMTFVIGSIFIGMTLEQIKIDYPKKEKPVKTIRYSVTALTCLFCIVSSVVYVLIGLGK